MRAKLIRDHGNTAVVLVLEQHELPRAYVIDIKYVKGMRSGEEFDISDEAIDAGTEYSVDWDIVVPEGFHIPSSKIHAALISRGIYTFEDYRNNQREVQDALNVLIGEFRMFLSNKVKEIGG